MTTQASLFGGELAREPPKPQRIKIGDFVREPAEPWGEMKRGKYWYERYREELRELPEETREMVLEMILGWSYERREAVRLLLDKWNKAKEAERDNFREAMGR